MSEADFQLHGIRDPRLAVHATSALPAWVWSTNGATILWANTVGASLFGARNAAALAEKIIGPADPHRRQAMQLAARLSQSGGSRLERLRGFGAPLGRLLTCACARLTFADGTTGILIAAAEPVGRAMPLTERLAHLVDSVTMPAMTFTPNGALAGANDAAKTFAGLFNDLTGPGFDDARANALRDGQSVLQMDLGRVTVHRVGNGEEAALVALIDAVIVPKQMPKPTAVVVAPVIAATPAPVIERVTPASEPSLATPEALQNANVIRHDLIAEPVQAAPIETPVVDVPHAETAREQIAEAGPLDTFVSVFDEPDTAPVASAETLLQESVETATPPEHSPMHESEAPETVTPPETTHETPAQLHTPSSDGVTRIYIGDERPKSATQTVDTDHNHVAATLSDMDGAPLTDRQYPLRFMWHMDEEGRFSLGFDEFARLIGSRTAAAFGRPWSEIADALGLDPEGRVAAAAATRDTWSSIVVNWPADGAGARLPVELSALPIYDRAGKFLGYRGFGVCRDIEGMARLAAQRRDDVLTSSEPAASSSPGVMAEHLPDEPMPILGLSADAQDNSPTTESKPPVDTLQNVVLFPSATEPKSPVLTAGESSAFDELARRLSARLEGAQERDAHPSEVPSAEQFLAAGDEPPHGEPAFEPPVLEHPPAFLSPASTPPRASSAQDPQLLDRLPLGVLVYRLDRLLYANPAFLDFTGYASLHALSEAGGLDALYVEANGASATSTSESGTPVLIAAAHSDGSDRNKPADARLFAISWDNEPAHALMFSGSRSEPHSEPSPLPAAIMPIAAPDDDTTQAEEFSTILDATTEGVVIFDGHGRVLSCNRAAEVIFGRSDNEITTLGLIDLFAPESQRAALDYVDGIKSASVTSLIEHSRDMQGRVRDGSSIPLSMTIGRMRPDNTRFFAILRDMSHVRKAESELLQARRQAERSASAKSDILGRISHEVRMPLNAIIGFADVMIQERFGALGNERYVEYMKDIRASGQRVMAIIDDLLDLQRIESGKMELSFANNDLNSMVEQCVAVMQPQANRERIIIRTSLAHALPTVKADARALRQIALNLIGNSIHLANAGGQVIVSTATTDFGDIVLRVRDTGHGLNDNEIAAAMAPFRTTGASDQTADGSVVNLSLTKALVEANRAQFHIKTAPHSGTLIEVVFSHASAIA